MRRIIFATTVLLFVFAVSFSLSTLMSSDVVAANYVDYDDVVEYWCSQEEFVCDYSCLGGPYCFESGSCNRKCDQDEFGILYTCYDCKVYIYYASSGNLFETFYYIYHPPTCTCYPDLDPHQPPHDEH